MNFITYMLYLVGINTNIYVSIRYEYHEDVAVELGLFQLISGSLGWVNVSVGYGREPGILSINIVCDI